MGASVHWSLRINYNQDHLFFSNPSIYNITRWFAGSFGQTSHRPIVWCSKYYYTFHNFLQNSLRKLFQFSILFFVVKIKSFECLCLRNYEKSNAWNVKCLVSDSKSVLHHRLMDFSAHHYRLVGRVIHPFENISSNYITAWQCWLPQWITISTASLCNGAQEREQMVSTQSFCQG